MFKFINIERLYVFINFETLRFDSEKNKAVSLHICVSTSFSFTGSKKSPDYKCVSHYPWLFIRIITQYQIHVVLLLLKIN